MKIFFFLFLLILLIGCSYKENEENKLNIFTSVEMEELSSFLNSSFFLRTRLDSVSAEVSEDSVLWLRLHTNFDSLNEEVAFMSSMIFYSQLDTALLSKNLLESDNVNELGLVFYVVQNDTSTGKFALRGDENVENYIEANPNYVQNWAYMINELSIAQIEELKIIYNNCLIEEGLVEAHLPFDNFLSISSNESTQLLSHVAIYSCMLHSAREYHRMDLSDHIQWLFDNSFEGHSISLDGT